MANMRGRTLKGVNLLATYKESQIFENDKRGYLTVQVDQRGRKGEEDSNPYLSTQQLEDGKYSHSDSYALDQIKAIEAGGKSITQPDGTHVIAFKADLFTTDKDKKRGPKLVVNTKNGIEKSDFTLSKKTLENQNKLTQEAKDAKKAKSATKMKEVPEGPAQEGAEMEAEAEVGA